MSPNATVHLAVRLGNISTEPHFSLRSDLQATFLSPLQDGGDCGARIEESSTDQHTRTCILKQAS